ncbi:AMP-binding protein [Thalassotalea fusca]
MTLDHLRSQSTLFVTEQASISGEQFLADLSRYYSQLSGIENNKQVLLFESDTYQFAVKFYALSLSGFDIYLPQNGQPQTLAALTPRVGFCAGSMLSIDGLDNLDERIGLNQPTNVECCWPESGKVYFSTSGSTGEPKIIEKCWQHLNRECDTLITTFDLGTEDAYLSTVPHFHIYGLLFKLLVPLKLAVPIWPMIEFPEQGLAQLQRVKRCVLVSSPAFLKRLAINNHFAAEKNKLVRVFSSGGPLADDDAIKLYQQLNVGVTQVYGSTESGGIAFRQVTYVPAPLWQPFKDIDISVNNSGQLLLRSAYIAEASMLMDDKIELIDGQRFKLCGRVDRTIKLEEKRINLSEVEALLMEHTWVAEAKVLVLNGKRQELAAVIGLSEEGQLQIESMRRFVFNRQLNHWLAEKFESVVRPRKWRYVHELPYNAQGKIEQATLEKLFE